MEFACRDASSAVGLMLTAGHSVDGPSRPAPAGIFAAMRAGSITQKLNRKY